MTSGYHQLKQQPDWEFQQKLCKDGRVRGESKRTGHPEITEDSKPTQSTPCLELNQQTTEKQFSTQELVAEVRKTTSIHRLTISYLNILGAKSFETSEVDSTCEEKVYSPYWNEFCQAMSSWLWFPTKTDFAVLGSTITHGWRANSHVKFWFSTTTYLAQKERWSKIFLPLSTYFHADYMDSENTKKRSKKTLKYRVYPTGETKKVWMLRIHGVRKVYNNAIAYLNKHQGFTYINTKGEVKTTGKREFRSFCKTLDSEIIPQWCKDLQIAHALDNALFEAYTAWKKTDRQPKFLGQGPDRKPNPNACKKMAKFRSIRSKNQTIQYDPHDYKNGHWMASSGLEKAEFWGQDYCLINYKSASELTYNKGRWYANFPVEMDAQPPRNGGKAIALDPGVRCFLTGFDGNNFTEFANGDFALIAKLCYHLDKLRSKHDQAKSGKFKRYRYKLRRAMERIRTRIHNLRSECHKQVASYLARNYDVIYLPTFETSKMVSRSKRKLHSKTARAMMTWAFYEFSQTLQHLCNRYGSRLVRVTEEYTSKTCTNCGHVHTKLGGNKTFKCPDCGTIIKRDFNGALGIFLKALWDTTQISTVCADSVVLSLACPECLG